MAANGVKTMGYIGFADAYGEGWFQEMQRKAAELRKLQDRRQRDVQPHRHLGHRPGAEAHVRQARRGADRRLGHAGRAAAEELKERGYKGKIYQTHGVANADFLRVGGKDVEGTFLPAGPMLVAEQLPASNPVKKSRAGLRRRVRGRERQGHASRPSARHAWDTGLLMAAAVPVALKKAQPGTPEFRAALRDALEQVKELPGAHGVFNMTANDHHGLDQRARVMVKIENGAWKYQP